jgi:hypothetical protein
MKKLNPSSLVAFAVLGVFLFGSAQGETNYLAYNNTVAPFPYLQEGTRSWPILRHALPEDAQVIFTAKVGDQVLAEGPMLNLPGLTVSLSEAQQLTVVAETQDMPLSFSLDIRLNLPGQTSEQQTLSVLPAPPLRPLSYLADFGDDLIRIFNSASDGRWAPVTKDAFDQYFRRCQLHGIDRMIMWLSPMPYIAEPTNYEPDDWTRYEAQARALTESAVFRDLIVDRKKGAKEGHWGLHIPWDWIRQLNAYRLVRDFGPVLSQSAVDHGIKLTASFRPFETALTKYYELPAFDSDGAYLWGFLPMASPTINYRTSETAFAHYRTILEKMGMPDKGRIGRIAISGVTDAQAFLKRFQDQADNLQIVASNYPPLLADSLVLQRQPDATFDLVKFSDFAAKAEAKLDVLTDFSVRAEGDTLHIDNIDVSSEYRYLILSNPVGADEALDLPTLEPVRLFAKAGNALGRENVYWVLDENETLSRQTRVPGIPKTGGQSTEFNATEMGYRHLYQKGEARTILKNRLLVIDLGAPYSVEMLDLNQPATRENVIKEMKTLLDLPAFDELFVNTRSHVQLSAYQGDGDEGIKPRVHYRQKHKSHAHLGIDRAYAPLVVADDPTLTEWAADPERVERITTWQEGAWAARCQQETSPYRWRYARNKAVANGVRLLLQDFEVNFPDARVRALIPMGEASANRVLDQVETLQRPDGTPYGREYNGIWTTINHIRSIGEGMAMLDLTGLKTEPVLFGVRDVPDAAPFDIHFQESLRDLTDNRGSAFHGPRSFFFEAQYSLRRKDYDVARKQREDLICKVLSFEEDVKEVILYESADWLYYLSFSDPDLSGNYFIERCGDAPRE